MSVTFSVLNRERSMDLSSRQPLNIMLMLLISSVLRCSMPSMAFSDEKLSNHMKPFVGLARANDSSNTTFSTL